MKGNVHSYVLPLVLSVCDIGLCCMWGVISTSKPQPACMAAHPLILIQPVRPISSTVAPQHWRGLMNISDSYHLGYKSLTLSLHPIAAMNIYGMFMEEVSKNMSYFTLSTITTSHHRMIGLLIFKKCFIPLRVLLSGIFH